MKKTVLLITFVFLWALMVCGSDKGAEHKFNGKTVLINSSDGLMINADIYEVREKTAPVILLFHQAGFSRGEYRETAPLLNELGFFCIAIDQRSGKGVNGVTNEAVLAATKRGLGVKYPDAFPDLEATLKFAIQKFPSSKIIVWGSSYSASLVFVLAQKIPGQNFSCCSVFTGGIF